MTKMPPRSASAITAEQSLPRRVRLLLLTDTAVGNSGGSERFLRNLLSRLPTERYDITLVQLADDDRHDDAALFGIAHAAVLRQPVAAIYGPGGWQALMALRRLARQQPFDVVQSQHEKSDLLNALLSRRLARVRISNRRDMGFNKSARLRMLFRWLNHRFDRVVAPAQAILDGLVDNERLDRDHSLCIANGVDTQWFTPLATARRAQAREALGIAGDALTFVCVASLTPVKRHVDLLEAFRLVRDRHPRARLLLVGDGPLREAVTAQRSALSLDQSVTLLGNRADVEAILPAADIGVLASSTEGMSNAILEMMACGLPIIATDVGGNPRLVTDGVVGTLVPACAPEALAVAMVALAESAAQRAQMATAARTLVEREYSLTAMASAFDRLYQRLLAEHAVSA